jgi:nitrate/nitrite transporter NarK
MRSFVKVAAVGFSGVVFFKFLAMPIVTILIGLVAMTMKFALIAAVGYFVYSLFLKRDDDSEDDAEEEIQEAEVVGEE